MSEDQSDDLPASIEMPPRRELVRAWDAHGRMCLVTKDTLLGHYCGYVHASEDASFEEIQDAVSVNGGLTYGVDSAGFVGFDCAHAWDHCVDADGKPFRDGRAAFSMAIEDLPYEPVTWTPERVARETEQLAAQIDALDAN